MGVLSSNTSFDVCICYRASALNAPMAGHGDDRADGVPLHAGPCSACSLQPGLGGMAGNDDTQ